MKLDTIKRFFIEIVAALLAIIFSIEGLILLIVVGGMLFTMRSISGCTKELTESLEDRNMERELGITSMNCKICVKNKYEKYFYVDKNGTQIIPFTYDEANPFSDNRAIVKMGQHVGVIDTAGRYIHSPCLKKASIFHYGMSRVRDTNNQIFFLNLSGVRVPDFELKDAELFYNNYAGIKTKKGWGIMDNLGKIVIQPKYDDFIRIDRDNFFIFENNDKWGALDLNDNHVLPFVYERPVIVNYALLLLESKNEITAYNLDAREKLHLAFDTIVGLNYNRIGVQKDTKWMLYDNSGRCVSSQKFDTIKSFDYFYAAEAKLNGVWHEIDTLGAIIAD